MSRTASSDRTREVALELAGMIEAGRAADAVPLARRAVERVTSSLLHIDDSSGVIGADLRELTGLYARACAIAPPDAAKLAAWLVASRCDGPGWPDFAVADFALSGDVDAHVAVLARDARSGHDFGEIVSVLRDAGRNRAAEEWARKGLAAGPLSPWADALREQLAGLLLQQRVRGRGRRHVPGRIRAAGAALRLPSAPEGSRAGGTVEGATGLGTGPHARTGAHGRVPAGPSRRADLRLLDEDLAAEAWSTAADQPDQVSQASTW